MNQKEKEILVRRLYMGLQDIVNDIAFALIKAHNKGYADAVRVAAKLIREKEK